MTFHLGFSTPTELRDCGNQTMQGMPIGGQDYPRGIQVSTSQSAIAQVTVHMDHPFWESFAEDSPVHWDQIAAQYVGVTGVPVARVEDMKGVAFNAFTDKLGTPLPWRNCSGPNYTPPGNAQMFFNPLSVPVNPGDRGTDRAGLTKDNCPALRDYYDYIRYSQSFDPGPPRTPRASATSLASTRRRPAVRERMTYRLAHANRNRGRGRRGRPHRGPSGAGRP